MMSAAAAMSASSSSSSREPSRDHCRADHASMAAFADALQAEGVRIARRGTLFLSTAHGEREVERTLAAADAAFRRLPEA